VSGNRASQDEILLSKLLRRFERIRNDRDDETDIIAIPMTVVKSGALRDDENKRILRIKERDEKTIRRKQLMFGSSNPSEGHLFSQNEAGDDEEGVLPAPLFEKDGSLINRVYPRETDSREDVRRRIFIQ
jgi:hypothetical protein